LAPPASRSLAQASPIPLAAPVTMTVFSMILPHRSIVHARLSVWLPGE
jgi:hypothetical protein